MTEKEKLPEWIDRFTSNELEGEELQKFLDMLRSDPELRKEVKLDHDLNEVLSDEDMLDFRQRLMQEKNKNRHTGFDLHQLLLAASLLIMVGMGFLLYYLGVKDYRKSVTGNRSLIISDSLAKHPYGDDQNKNYRAKGKPGSYTINTSKDTVERSEQLAMSGKYTPYLPFESLVGITVRSWDFRLVSPKTLKIQQGDIIRFQWETGKKSFISLQIMDNRGTMIYPSIPGHNKIIYIRGNTFLPGLYYFKFLRNDEIIYFGKFEIR